MRLTPEKLVIVTGLSGSGKSFVQSTLEDLGFYCVDNLPVPVIEGFLDELLEFDDGTRGEVADGGNRHGTARELHNYGYTQTVNSLKFGIGRCRGGGFFVVRSGAFFRGLVGLARHGDSLFRFGRHCAVPSCGLEDPLRPVVDFIG